MEKCLEFFLCEGTGSHQAIAQPAAVGSLVLKRTVDVVYRDHFSLDQQIAQSQ
jgi:hypothetical protein